MKFFLWYTITRIRRCNIDGAGNAFSIVYVFVYDIIPALDIFSVDDSDASCIVFSGLFVSDNSLLLS